MTVIQLDILQFAKQSNFHVSLQDYLNAYPSVDGQEAADALKGLWQQHLVCAGTDLMTSVIRATDAACEKMGWC